MTTVAHIRETLEQVEELLDFEGRGSVDPTRTLIDSVRELLGEPTNVQALALARLIREREGDVYVAVAPFGLPEGFWQVEHQRDSFVCGIAPDGSVSS